MSKIPDYVPPKDEIRFLGDVQRLTLGPDDVLVISCDHPISVSVLEHIKTVVQDVLGTERKVLVIDSTLKLGVLEVKVDPLGWVSREVERSQADAVERGRSKE